MAKREEMRNLETIPVGSLGIIALKGCQELGEKVDQYLVDWRTERENEHKDSLAFKGYQRSSYLLQAKVPRFGSGEAKGVILESVRGNDLYLLVDVANYSLTYSLCGHENHMSPDDHYQDLKRIIAAVGGKARRITVIMPFCTKADSIREQHANHLTVHWLCRSLPAWVLTISLLSTRMIPVYRTRSH